MAFQFLKNILERLLSKRQGTNLNIEIPRAPRIKPNVIHNVHFHSNLRPLGSGGIFNISVTGIGLVNLGLPPDFEIGTRFPGTLDIAGKSFAVLLRAAHINESVVGCAFEGDTQEISKAVYNYFIGEISGMEVTEVNSSLLKEDSRGQPRWFFGSNNSEVYIVESQGRIVYFHITLLGNYFESYADEAPKFGYVLSGDSKNKLKPNQSSLIQYTSKLPQETINLIEAFVRSMTALPQEHKAFIISVLSE